MIQLQRLMIKNFKSFGNTPQIVQLDKLGLSLLVGKNKDEFKSNGAGKSSFLEAIVYALFGSTSDGERGDSLVNRKIGKDMEVVLSFTKGKDTYTIVRFRKDSKNKNKSYLFLNKKNITQRSIKATNQYLVNVLGIDKETYLHSYAFGLNSDVSFASMTDREKKKVLDDMAHLSIYPVARSIAKDDADTVQTKITNLKSKIDTVKYSKRSLAKLQKRQYQEDKKIHNDSLKLKHHLFALKKKCLSIGQTRHNHSYDYYKNDVKKYTDKINHDYIPKINSYKKRMSKVDLDKQAINVLSNHMTSYNDKKKSLMSDNAELLKKLKHVILGKQKTCYWCGQVLSSENKKHLQVQMAKKYKATQHSIKQMANLQQTLFNKMNVVKLQCGRDKKQVPDISVEEKAVSNAHKHINDDQNQMLSIKNDLLDLKHTQKQYDSMVNSSGEDYTSDLKNVMDKLSDLANKLKSLKFKLKLYKQSEDIYSNHGVKSMVLDLILPFINKRANHYLQILTSGDITIFIQPTTTSKSTGNTSQKINLQVTNLHGADNYSELSSGEKKRVDLSIVLSLQDYVLSHVSSQMNLCFYDELFSHLDPSSYEGVMKILIDRLKVTPNIVVVTHQPELMEKFDKQLIVTKQNGISVVSAK